MSLTYINNTLAPDETILGRIELTKWQYFWPFLFSPILIGLLFALWTLIVRNTTELAYTNKRVITKRGIIRRGTDEVRIGRIESVDLK